VAPAEAPTRTAAPEVIRQLGRLVDEHSDGPFYAATVELLFDGTPRQVGFIAQDRSVKNGVWMPEHHLLAAERITQYSKRSLPIVTLMDTPGADPGEVANANNQAHSISRLIVEMSNVDVPNVGIVFGLGYSGGAIPLAASNMILSLRDGVFSTIQPKGLASIARRLNLSWQECAKYVGLSPYELYEQGNIDGVIDYSPGEEGDKLDNFRNAIVVGIQRVEERTKEFVAENPYILDHYRQSLQRYLNPSEQLKQMQAEASLKITKNPTEYLNVFGAAYRYLRYLKVRRRIKATTTSRYGRLADRELPRGELDLRAEYERRQTFLRWLQDPDRIVYDETLSKAWKNYNEKKQAVHDERGRIAQLLFGEPKKNYEEARATLLTTVGIFLYNRWKADALGNLRALKNMLAHPEDIRQVLGAGELENPRAVLEALREDEALLPQLRSAFSHEGRQLLDKGGAAQKSDAYLANQLATELNMVITGESLLERLGDEAGDQATQRWRDGAPHPLVNRGILERRTNGLIPPAPTAAAPVPFSDMTVLDVLMSEDLRYDFIVESESLLLFDSVYDHIIANLDSIAAEAQSAQALSRDSLAQLIDTTLNLAAKGVTIGAVADEWMAASWQLSIQPVEKQVRKQWRDRTDLARGL